VGFTIWIEDEAVFQAAKSVFKIQMGQTEKDIANVMEDEE
jgi:hypothetical protein